MNYVAPKTQLIELLQSTAIGDEFVFTIDGNELVARRYIHAMREHLTRLRKRATNKGMKRREFKIKLVGIEEIITAPDQAQCKITLHRTITGADVDDLLDGIVGDKIARKVANV